MNKKLILNLSLLYFLSSQCNEISKEKTIKQVIKVQTKNAPKASGPYSQAIKIINAHEMLFIAGQLPIVPETGLLLTEAAEATKQCMRNLSAILKEAHMDFKNVVEATILLKNIADFPIVNETYESFLQEPYPARMTFQAGALPKDALIEIKMIAVK